MNGRDAEFATRTYRVVAQAAALISRFALLRAERETLFSEQTKMVRLHSRAVGQYRRDVRVLFLMHSSSDSEHFVV